MKKCEQNWKNQQKSGRPERGFTGSTGLKRKSVQGGQSEMSTHGENFLDSSKTREVNYSHHTRVHIYQVWKGVINIRSKRILERHYQSNARKITCVHKKTHVVEQGEAVASLSFGGKDVDSKAEGKIGKKPVTFSTDFVQKVEAEIIVR